jgi:YggT family protein
MFFFVLFVVVILMNCEIVLGFKIPNLVNNKPVYSINKQSTPPIKNKIENIILVSSIVLLGEPLVTVATSEEITVISFVRPSLEVFVNTLNLFFLCRTVLSWYPKTNLKKFPFNIVSWPTEPLLEPVRSLIPPAFGVDISSLVWIMLLSFVREILVGQQGILTLVERS